MNLENLKELNGISLENVSDKEKQALLQILNEYQKTGISKTFEDLKYADYNEIPVDILTFILDDNYLGKAWHDTEGKSKLYPFWEDKFKNLFNTNIDTSVNNLILSGARGLGKSEIAVTCGAYLMYRVLCLKDPLLHFGLKPTEKICFAFMNITKTLAEDIAIAKFQNTIQMSPWFMSRGSMTQKSNQPYWIPPEPINIIIGSQPSHVIGLPILFAIFDEIDFIRNQDIDKQKQKAIDMIDTAIGGMKTRFIKNGANPSLLILASSKRSDKSFLEEHTKKKLESEAENVLVVEDAVWNVKPKGTYSSKTFKFALGNKFLTSTIIKNNEDVESFIKRGYTIMDIPIDFRDDFLIDPDRALCDFAGIASSELSKYISGEAINEIINIDMSNPFTRDIIEVGNGPEDKTQYSDFFDIAKVSSFIKSRPLYVHLDMSVSGDMTGIAGVCIKDKRTSTESATQNKDLFYSLVFSVSVKAPKGRQISFEKNRQFIYWLKEQGFNLKGVSSDTFQSYDTGQTLLSKGIPYEVLSVDRVDTQSRICKPYQYLKSTIYEKRIEIYNSKTLIEEWVNLERNINTGKVDHPKDFRKDVSDAVTGALFEASKNAEQYAYDYGEDLTVITQINSGKNNFREQMTTNFEDELKNILMNNYLGNSNKNTKDNGLLTNNGGIEEPSEADFSGLYNISNGIMVW